VTSGFATCSKASNIAPLIPASPRRGKNPASPGWGRTSGFAKQGQKSRFAGMGKNFRLRPEGAIEKKFLGLFKTKRL